MREQIDIRYGEWHDPFIVAEVAKSHHECLFLEIIRYFVPLCDMIL